MVDFNGISIKSSPNGTNAVLTRKCPFCGKEHSITVEQHGYLDSMDKLRAGALIQDAFPSFTPDERELIMTGICPKCWNEV